jgi:hypothetical protein
LAGTDLQDVPPHTEDQTEKCGQPTGTVSEVQKKDILAKIRMIFTVGSAVVLGAVLLLAIVMLSSQHPLHRFLSGLGMTVLTIELLFFVYWYIKNKPPKEDH